mmetsp:Transcript_32740/g.82492  ORF Transcript_32740/g.82492 Transcript_32740/m.82492 type:complete len:102 (-) Transcript_32740:16-321(-)
MPRLRNLTLNSVWLDDGDMAALATLSSLQELSTSFATMANDRRDTLTGAGLAELTRVGLQYRVHCRLQKLQPAVKLLHCSLQYFPKRGCSADTQNALNLTG